MTQDPWPPTPEDALAEGYARLSTDEARKRNSQFAAPAPLPLCLTQPPGTICHRVTRPNGDRIVGYCNGAGQCILYLKPGQPNDDN